MVYNLIIYINENYLINIAAIGLLKKKKGKIRNE